LAWEGAHAALKTHRTELFEPKIAQHRGRLVETTGDGLLVEFPSVVDALRCAVEVQREMAKPNEGVPIVDDIITALSRYRSLFVVARNSSFTYKGRATCTSASTCAGRRTARGWPRACGAPAWPTSA
jgi:class 3 adenylate cyclase